MIKNKKMFRILLIKITKKNFDFQIIFNIFYYLLSLNLFNKNNLYVCKIFVLIMEFILIKFQFLFIKNL